MEQGSPRIIGRDADPLRGAVKWKPAKSLWISAMTLVALIAGPLTFSWNAFAVFIILTAITLCAGHSVGMHRLMIHRSFETPRWLEYVLVYLGVLVGMAGPFGMTWQHDLRDWAQRQRNCHDYLCHRRDILQDYFWQIHCDIDLNRPPQFAPEPQMRDNEFYRWLERTWMWQQLPVAAILFAFGGWSFVIWGVAMRVFIGVTGHWLVGHFAHHEYRHTDDDMSWRVTGAAVQGRDVRFAGLISMGESWHNNHHAYPGSAKIGLLPGQPDPGWWFIIALEKLGLAHAIKTPEIMPKRAALLRLSNEGTGWSACKLRKQIWKNAFGIA